MDFYDLDLHDFVLDALDDMQFTEATPIQAQTIPLILEGKDVLGIAQTGTGKTAAYLLPVLSMLQRGGFPEDSIQCIIMSPTRELAQQIDNAIQGFSYYLDRISCMAVYGGNDGMRYAQEKTAMMKGASIVVATPGRLLSHLSLGNLDVSRISFFILDEADRMLDMGFLDDILKISGYLPSKRQTIMFSATMPSKIHGLAKSILTNPVEVSLAVSKPADKINQHAYICYEAQKKSLLTHILSTRNVHRAILFLGNKNKTKELTIELQRKGFDACPMHSDLDQKDRNESLHLFRTGKVKILVATDIIARGIDVDDVQLVINYDVPRDEEDYVHRIGRTARAGKDGEAITIVSEKEQYLFGRIERFLTKEVEKLALPTNLGDAPSYMPVRPKKPSSSRPRKKEKNKQKPKHTSQKQQSTESRQNKTVKQETSHKSKRSHKPRKRKENNEVHP